MRKALQAGLAMALLLTGSGARALRLIEDAGFEASLPAEAPSQP